MVSGDSDRVVSVATRSTVVRLVGVTLCVAIVCGSVLAVGVVADPGTQAPGIDTQPTVGSSADDEALAFDYTFERIVERPGYVRISVTTTAPDHVTSVTVSPPDGATVETTTGYKRTGENEEFIWESPDGSEATFTYVTPVNATDDGGQLKGVDTGEWALFQWHSVDLHWSHTRQAGTQNPTVVERPAGTVGSGVVGPGVAYLGPYETETRTVGGERIRVVAPEAANPAETPAAIADALASASDDLRIGARNNEVTAVIAPEPIAVTGRMIRAGLPAVDDMYVREDKTLTEADNAWFHEYVHTRQEYETDSDMAWLHDGSAEYYAAWLTYEQGSITQESFYEYVRTERHADSVLADASTNQNSANYFKGMRVLAAADAEIRATSNESRTLQDVMVLLNAHEGAVTSETFANTMSEVTGESYDEWVTKYVTTPAVPSVPSYLGAVSGDVWSGDSISDITDIPVLGVILFVAAVIIGAIALSRQN